MRARLVALAVGLAAVTVLAGCSGSSDGGSGGAAASGSAAATGAGGGKDYYVSLGDSYAAGYQPVARGHGRTTTNGFADQIVTKAKAKGYDYTLANFGCGGATTQSMLSSSGCRTKQYAPGATRYSSTQTAAAVSFLKAHRDHVGLVTVSIGGNDVIPCGRKADVIGCLTSAIATMRKNLNTIVARVRAATGPTTAIVGTSYPDIFLGNLLLSTAASRSLATLSVTAFKSVVNPQLQQGYAAVDGKFVDVTGAFGGYVPLTQTTTLAPFGTIPQAVAKICTLTYYCELQDIHPRTPGYAIIADLVVGTLPKR